MRRNETEANIYLPLNGKAPVAVCHISYYEDGDGNFFYVFAPQYTVIDQLPPTVFHGIQGLNLNLRKEKYIRKNVLPTFISERAPIRTREDLPSLTAKVGMAEYIPLLWLKQTDMKYFGDTLFVAD